uniref:RxLR effector candidate protein n=1 Tax=Hyaloperonospora arabidopsidis (strain Emoy2) TaxID=559515 RepID=M4BPP4_HYAAE
MGACFPMALLSHRMCLVVLVDETFKVNHQLGALHPAVMRRCIAAPANKTTHSLPLHVTVVQDTLHVKALATMRIHRLLWWGREYQHRIFLLQADVARPQQRVHDLYDRTEQERQKRLSLETWVQCIRLYRSDDRSELAFYQLENERRCQAFRDEVADIRRQHAALQSQIEKPARVQNNLLEVFERGGRICPRKRPRADGTGGDDRHKT